MRIIISPAKQMRVDTDSFACTETKTGSDGSLTVTFTAPDTDWLIGSLLGYGSDLIILSPKKVRDKVMQMAKSVTELYLSV